MRNKMLFFFLSLFVLFSLYGPRDGFAVENRDKTYDVIIVGGGIAGLTAAFYLGEYDLLVLEKNAQVGGRASSGKYRGISFARGAEYLGAPEAPLEEIIRLLELKLREIPAPADAIASGGKMYFGDYGRASLLVARSSLGEFNRFALKVLELYEEYEEIPEIKLDGELGRMDTITARQWFEENHFSPIYSDFYNVSFRGLFGANIDEISALSALPEIAFDFQGVEQIDEDLAEAFADDGNSTGMYSFEGGIAEIPLALAKHLGDRLQTGTKVTGIRRLGEDLFEVTCTLADNTEKTYRAETVIVATPAAITLDIAGEVLSQEQRYLLDCVEYSPYITIALFSEKPVFNQAFDLAVPDGYIFTDIYDATWIARYFNNTPDMQLNRITLAYVAPQSYKDSGLLMLPDKELIGKVLSQLDQILPGASDLVKGWEISRFRYGYPVMTPGSYQRMNRLYQVTGKGLFLAGDYLVYPTFEAAAISGHNAALEVMDWMKD